MIFRLSQISFRPQQKDLRKSKGWDYSRCPGGDSQLREDCRWLVVDQLGLAAPNQRVGLLADTAEWVHCHWLGRLDVVVTLPKDHLSAQLREVVGVTTSAGSRPCSPRRRRQKGLLWKLCQLQLSSPQEIPTTVVWWRHFYSYHLTKW